MRTTSGLRGIMSRAKLSSRRAEGTEIFWVIEHNVVDFGHATRTTTRKRFGDLILRFRRHVRTDGATSVDRTPAPSDRGARTACDTRPGLRLDPRATVGVPGTCVHQPEGSARCQGRGHSCYRLRFTASISLFDFGCCSIPPTSMPSQA